MNRILLSLLGIAIIAHLILLAPVPFVVQAVAVLILTGLLPGLLLVELLVGQSEAPPALGEHILYAIGAGYGIMVVVMLLVSYLPGGVKAWQTFGTFDLLFLILLTLTWWRGARGEGRNSPFRAQGAHARSALDNRWLLVGFVVLLVLGGAFRLVNLGYAEFQGDEARAVLRAAAVIQGQESILMLHKKGPTEILLPTVLYSLTGHINETTARLPFALANLAGLFALWLLGWRLFGPLIGWIAAMFLALDGYFIGFAHIVQYQSVIFLTSVLAVLIFYRLYREPKALTAYMTLAALLLATGLLSHYEGVWAFIPIACLLVGLLWRGRVQWPKVLGATAVAVVVGGVLAASFYVPFVLHPHFAATYAYLAQRRISGGGFPYNNLADFFLRTTVYSTTYYTVLLIVLTLAALALTYRQSLRSYWRVVIPGVLLLLLGITLIQPTWLTLGGKDWAFSVFLVALFLAWVLPNIKLEDRMLWLWFGIPLLVGFFATSKPRTHIYVFFMPWVLLTAAVLGQGFAAFRRWTSDRVAMVTGSVVALALLALFGNYAWQYFVYNKVEILRTWDQNRPPGYWVGYDVPDNRALFGFPLANGWKVIGDLYNKGVIQGQFDTNEKEAWVPAWYTRGADRCKRTASWFFQIDNLEPFPEGDRLAMVHYLRQGFHKWGIVEINETNRMLIYYRKDQSNKSADPTVEPNAGLPVYHLNDYKAAFDQLAGPQFPLVYPVVDPIIGHPLHINFNREIWLQGYDIAYEKPLHAGDVIHLKLYWQAQKPLDQSYKVFNQSYYGNGKMIAQQDGYPGCENNETWRWDPGETIEDPYDIHINADAPDGLYPLYTGLYLEQNFERLPIIAADGKNDETQVHLTDIRVGKE